MSDLTARGYSNFIHLRSATIRVLVGLMLYNPPRFAPSHTACEAARQLQTSLSRPALMRCSAVATRADTRATTSRPH